jgi:hypothetical protein
MKPVFQSDRGNPERTEAGDCFRACVASILERPLDTVPHFFPGSARRHGDLPAKGNRDAGLVRATRDGLRHPAVVGRHAGSRRWACSATAIPDLYYILIGQTRKGVNHAIVCRGNYVAHDPARPAIGLAGPQGNGVFTVGIIAFSEWK